MSHVVIHPGTHSRLQCISNNAPAETSFKSQSNLLPHFFPFPFVGTPFFPALASTTVPPTTFTLRGQIHGITSSSTINSHPHTTIRTEQTHRESKLRNAIQI